MNAPHALPDRHARTILPGLVHHRLQHLALDLGVSLADLLVEGALLVCRLHDRSDGLPEPTPPFTSVHADAEKLRRRT